MVSNSPECGYISLYGRCDLPRISPENNVCILHDQDENKDREFFFKTLRDKVIKEQSNPHLTEIDLEGIIFPKDFTWQEAIGYNTFGKEVSFYDAKFSGDVDFDHITFSKNVSFIEAKFHGVANFLAAEFIGEANFGGSTFRGFADFGMVTFVGDAIFEEAIVSGAATFEGARFNKALKFVDTAFPSQNSEGFIRFEDVKLEEPEQVLFTNVDLSKVFFLGTDVEDVHFTGVTWPRKPERLWLLPFIKEIFNVVFDHLEMERSDKSNEDGARVSFSGTRENKKALIGELYRQLRVNYERNRREIEGSHFYIGQVDMRLKTGELKWHHRQLFRLYRWLALYGESFGRPLAVYILFNLIAAFAYLYGGFTVAGKLIPCDFPPNLTCLGTFLDVYLHAVSIALTAGVSPGRELPDASWWQWVARFVNIGVDVLLIAFFIIALRRQFRR